ncbi:MAG: hypothetical protein VX596_10490, partial [Pseudomonadota bacterium]|nr:hypothetical protein [Pseudomonadota bacterium]
MGRLKRQGAIQTWEDMAAGMPSYSGRCTCEASDAMGPRTFANTVVPKVSAFFVAFSSFFAA